MVGLTKISGAWAIDTKSKEGHGIIGKLWPFKVDRGVSLPVHAEGCPTALFKTRAVARDAVKELHDKTKYQPFPNAQVVRVKVTIEVMRRDS